MDCIYGYGFFRSFLFSQNDVTSLIVLSKTAVFSPPRPLQMLQQGLKSLSRDRSSVTAISPLPAHANPLVRLLVYPEVIYVVPELPLTFNPKGFLTRRRQVDVSAIKTGSTTGIGPIFGGGAAGSPRRGRS
jgi:hypothetical protein